MQMKKRLVIAIDGPSAVGKSTVSKMLANSLDYTYVDTGAMYRAVALRVEEEGIDTDDEASLARLCAEVDILFSMENGRLKVMLDGRDVTEAIRSPSISLLASSVSAKMAVRDALLKFQRRIGKNGGVIVEGRDIGTVVFPDADIKFYLDALPEERGKRRYKELIEKGENVDLKEVTRETVLRDRSDSTREYAPLKAAVDAIDIDSTHMSVQELADKMLKIIGELG